MQTSCNLMQIKLNSNEHQRAKKINYSNIFDIMTNKNTQSSLYMSINDIIIIKWLKQTPMNTQSH